MRTLVTGGCGYIGSHVVIALIHAGLKPIILDNLSHSTPLVVDAIEEITGQRPVFFKADINDKKTLGEILESQRIDSVVHLAAYKDVTQSLSDPICYYENNVGGTIQLARACAEKGIGRLVFSSSASVYSHSAEMPVSEKSEVAPVTPYGKSKLMGEEILLDVARTTPNLKIANLRYFNPVGAHSSTKLPEPNLTSAPNLLPHIARVALGLQQSLNVYGADYPTSDGTGVRDYIHVEDLAEGHLAALNYLQRTMENTTINLGTGIGTSVLELVRQYELVSGRTIPINYTDRRAGDIGSCYAEVGKAKEELGWTAKRSLNEMCLSNWNSLCAAEHAKNTTEPKLHQ